MKRKGGQSQALPMIPYMIEGKLDYEARNDELRPREKENHAVSKYLGVTYAVVKYRAHVLV